MGVEESMNKEYKILIIIAISLYIIINIIYKLTEYKIAQENYTVDEQTLHDTINVTRCHFLTHLPMPAQIPFLSTTTMLYNLYNPDTIKSCRKIGLSFLNLTLSSSDSYLL